MTISTEKEEVVGVMDRLCNALSATISSNTGRLGVQLRNQIGDMRVNYDIWWLDGTFMTKLLACFTTARQAPVKLESLTVVRQALFAEHPVGGVSMTIVQGAITLCLSAEGRMITDIKFVSRDDVENMITKMGAAFDTARDLAADAIDSSNYQALTALAGSVISHLADVARPLPRMITFKMSKTMPALVVAQRFYYDPSRWEEIISENRTIHPAFVQREIRGLSA